MFSPQVMNTPPPNPLVFNKYRLRGTVTDPPFGQMCTPVERASCLANFLQFTDLCDIDEDEFVPYPPAFSPVVPTQLHSLTLPLNLHDLFDLSAGSDELYHDALSGIYPTFPVSTLRHPFRNRHLTGMSCTIQSLSRCRTSSFKLPSAINISANESIGRTETDVHMHSVRPKSMISRKSTSGNSSHVVLRFSNRNRRVFSLSRAICSIHSDARDVPRL